MRKNIDFLAKKVWNFLLPPKFYNIYGILDRIYLYYKLAGICPINRVGDENFKRYKYINDSSYKKYFLPSCVCLLMLASIPAPWLIKFVPKLSAFDHSILALDHSVLSCCAIVSVMMLTKRSQSFMDGFDKATFADTMLSALGVQLSYTTVHVFIVVDRLFLCIVNAGNLAIMLITIPAGDYSYIISLVFYTVQFRSLCFLMAYTLYTCAVIYNRLKVLNDYIASLKKQRTVQDVIFKLKMSMKIYLTLRDSFELWMDCFSPAILGVCVICASRIVILFSMLVAGIDALLASTVSLMLYTAAFVFNIAVYCEAITSESRRTGREICNLNLPMDMNSQEVETILYRLYHQEHRVILAGWFCMDLGTMLQGLQIVATFQMLLLQLRGNIQ